MVLCFRRLDTKVESFTCAQQPLYVRKANCLRQLRKAADVVGHEDFMKILYLTLKKKWFDMVLSGEKKDEYREIKPYWSKRLNGDHDCIHFRNGYSKDSPWFLISLCWICRGVGKKEWGAPDYPVYILSLGKVIKSSQPTTAPSCH